MSVETGQAGRQARRLWHLLGGLLFPLLAFFLAKVALLLSVAAAAAASLTLDLVRFLSPRLNRWLFRRLGGMIRDREWSQPTGTTYLLLASVLTFLLFEQVLASAALLFLAVGDPLAAIVGEQVEWCGGVTKSLLRGLAFFVVCLAVGVALWGVGVGLRGWVLLAGALSAAAVELLPLPLNDNLAIPLFSAGVMNLLVDYLY